VWEFDDINNLDQVTFEVKQRQGEGPGQLLTNQYIMPAVVAVVVLAAVGFMVMRRR
jgi:hypothetical protein